MMQFAFAALTREGEFKRGVISAWSREQAVRNLLLDGLAITDLHQVNTEEAMRAQASLRVSGETLALFYKRLSVMYNAGVPLQPALKLLAQGEPSAAAAKVMNGLVAAVDRGRSLAESMELYPGVFGPPHIAMMRAGEFGGFVTHVLSTLALFTERAEALHRKARSATTYPLFVLTVAVVGVVALFNTVVPQFIGLVEHFHAKIPMSTRILLQIALFLRSPWSLAGCVVLVGLGPRLYMRWMQSYEVRYLVDRHALNAIVFGNVTHKVAMARATQLLSALTRAGVSLIDALPLAGSACGNRVIERAFHDLVPPLTAGESLADTMEKNPKVFPSALVAYVATGETTGELPVMLMKAAELFEREAQYVLDTLPDLLEPLIIVVLGCVVGFIVLSFFLPLYGALQNIL